MDSNEIALSLWPDMPGTKTARTRNQQGQYATPPALAHAMLAETRCFMSSEQPLRFLDPAFGTGVFYAALKDTFPRRQIVSATGIEIDPLIVAAARARWQDAPLLIQHADFTTMPPPLDPFAKPNLIVCNPPYVRHHHLDRATKRRLQERMQSLGIRLSELAGLYCYFLLLAHDWLADDGIAVWLLPGEWMNVNYGKAVKEYLARHVTLLRLHMFDPAETQFDDALVSSTVVWFVKRPPATRNSFIWTAGGSLATPRSCYMLPHAALDEGVKWSTFGHTVEKEAVTFGATLGDLFTIKRGIATGANDFFILSAEQLCHYDLPKSCFIPILPSARFLTEQVIASEANGEPAIKQRLFLLQCNQSEDMLADRFPALWRYLQSGKERGVSARYLCAHRAPWYRQEQRIPAPFLCTYMGRQSAKPQGPFRFILNYSQATAPNTYLLLYPKAALAAAMKQQPSLLPAIWQALAGIPAEALIRAGRSYGGGLFKLEPKELAAVPAPALLASLK